MKTIKKLPFFNLFPFLLVVQLGCQSVDNEPSVPPSEFPTIEATDELHVVVQLGSGNEDSLYIKFSDVIAESFSDMGYPGKVTVHRWPWQKDDSAARLEIVVLRWVGPGAKGSQCHLHASIHYQGEKVDLGFVLGENTDALAEVVNYGEKAYELAAQKALLAVIDRFIPYTNMDS